MPNATCDPLPFAPSECVRFKDEPIDASQMDSQEALLPAVARPPQVQTAEAGLEGGQERPLGFANNRSDRIRDRIEPSQEPGVLVRGFVNLANGRSPERRFKLLQAWEGVVTEVGPGSVWADIIDLTERTRPTEVVEFSSDEVPQADHPLLVPGGVFYWTIGYDTSPGGTVQLVSEIRMRRTPAWSASTLDSVRSRARELLRRMQGNVEDPSATQ